MATLKEEYSRLGDAMEKSQGSEMQARPTRRALFGAGKWISHLDNQRCLAVMAMPMSKVITLTVCLHRSALACHWTIGVWWTNMLVRSVEACQTSAHRRGHHPPCDADQSKRGTFSIQIIMP